MHKTFTMKVRKMEMVVTKTSFAEAEEADNLYWSNTTTAQRLNSLFDLRMMVFGEKNGSVQKMVKVVTKRSLYEETD